MHPITRHCFAALLGLALVAGCGKPPPPPAPPPPAPPPPRPAPKAVATPKAAVDPAPPACAARDQQLAELYGSFVDAYSNSGMELTADGGGLLFLSDRGGGSYQLFVGAVDKPAAEPTPIAPAKDTVSEARMTPDGLYVLFLRDKNRDENTQIYRASVDGKEVIPLTSAPQRFHLLPRVKPDWKTIVYLRGLHKTGGMVLVSQSLDGGEARPIMRVKGFHHLTDLSPDGKQALIFQMVSLSQSRLLSVDLQSGKTTLLAPKKETDAHAHASAYSGDGKSVYVVTDEGAERARLNKIDASTGEVQASFADPAAEVGDLKVSRKQPLLAVLLDHGSHTSLKLLDAATLKEKVKVKVPLGLITLGEFDAEGDNLVVNISTPSAPADVFLLSTRNGRLQPARRDKRPGLKKLTPINATVATLESFDKTRVPLNLYLPRRLPRNKKLPVVVDVHGGPASSSTIRWNPMVSFLVQRGFAVVQPNVRGSTGFGKAYEKADNGRKRMDSVKDLGAVNEWVRQQPWADQERIVVLGGSYGGYMTYMALGHQPTLWRAGIGMVGVVNLVSFLQTTTGSIRLAFREEFGDLKTDRAFLREVSPLTVVERMRSPLFVYQGENDPRVPRSEQDQLVNALRQRGIPVEYMVAEDEGHSLAHRPNKLAFVSRFTRFLEQHLDLPGLPEGCAAPEAGESASEKPAAKGSAPQPKKAP